MQNGDTLSEYATYLGQQIFKNNDFKPETTVAVNDSFNETLQDSIMSAN